MRNRLENDDAERIDGAMYMIGTFVLLTVFASLGLTAWLIYHDHPLIALSVLSWAAIFVTSLFVPSKYRRR